MNKTIEMMKVAIEGADVKAVNMMQSGLSTTKEVDIMLSATLHSEVACVLMKVVSEHDFSLGHELFGELNESTVEFFEAKEVLPRTWKTLKELQSETFSVLEDLVRA
jgi:hypothetical protein